jgi:hypothetical protein
MHGASFAPHKYVLLHCPKKNRNLPTNYHELQTFNFYPSPYARVLGLVLDYKLYGTLTLHISSGSYVLKPLP